MPLSLLKLPNWQEKSSVLNTRAKHERETQGPCEVSLSSRVERPVSVSRARVSFPLFFYPPKLEATRSLKWESSCKHVSSVKSPSDLQPLQIDLKASAKRPSTPANFALAKQAEWYLNNLSTYLLRCTVVLDRQRTQRCRVVWLPDVKSGDQFPLWLPAELFNSLAAPTGAACSKHD